jgi:hypothetical protein
VEERAIKSKQMISETISNAARAFTFVSLKARHYLAQAMLLFLKSNEKHRIRSSLIFWTLFDQAKSVIERQKILDKAKTPRSPNTSKNTQTTAGKRWRSERVPKNNKMLFLRLIFDQAKSVIEKQTIY